MEVIDHEPAVWFLFQEGEALYLDTACELSAVGFSVLVCLSPEEADAYRLEGRGAVARLSEQIQWSPRAFQDRALREEFTERIDEAIRRWRLQQGSL